MRRFENRNEIYIITAFPRLRIRKPIMKPGNITLPHELEGEPNGTGNS